MTRDGALGLAALGAIAARQHGLFTTDQASAAGVTKGVLDRRVRTGELIPVDYGVYRSVLTPETWHLRLLASCLAGPAVASHRSGGVLWSIPIPDPRVLEVTALRHRRRKQRGIIWHESYLLDRSSVTEVEGIPVTSATRTVIDLAAVLDAAQLRRALDDVLRRRLTSINALGRMLDRMGPLRPGAKAMRALLDLRAGSAVPDSDLETQFELLLAAHGLPTPVSQHPVSATNGRRFRIDFAYPARMLGIELLGAAYHALPERWAADIERLGVLSGLGWHMLSFTHDQVVRQPDTVVHVVDVALRR